MLRDDRKQKTFQWGVKVVVTKPWKRNEEKKESKSSRQRPQPEQRPSARKPRLLAGTPRWFCFPGAQDM